MQNAFPRHHYLICISATPHPFEFLLKLFTHSRRDPFPTAPIPARCTIYVRNNGVFVFLFRRRGLDSGCTQLFLINKTSIVVHWLTLGDYTIRYTALCSSYRPHESSRPLYQRREIQKGEISVSAHVGFGFRIA